MVGEEIWQFDFYDRRQTKREKTGKKEKKRNGKCGHSSVF